MATAAAIAGLAYPFIALVGVQTIGPGPVVAVLITVILARVVTSRRRPVFNFLNVGLMAIVFVELAVAIIDTKLAARIYPVLMNAALLFVFATSLIRPPTIIERFARLSEPELDERGVEYTRKVTIAWCAFFVFNGSIALWTVIASGWTVWAAYNGGIAYGLAGLLFAIEFLIRKRVQNRVRVD